ncbi:LysM peptidoglycan-binding domain-containing protein [Cellulomonas sp. P22]|uniref:LysM peptidoglycan-binding domain-containing protein n=1 Tax=Cellulomonas sp. P22 TaxID=3373189 RepID=UPI00378C3FAC
MVIGPVAVRGEAFAGSLVPRGAGRAERDGLSARERVSLDTGAPLRLTTRGRWVVAVLSLVVVSLVGLIGTRAVADAPPPALESYTVMAGDTFWQIAADVAGPGEDVRDVILELVELNGLDGAGLMSGQQILLPTER